VPLLRGPEPSEAELNKMFANYDPNIYE